MKELGWVTATNVTPSRNYSATTLLNLVGPHRQALSAPLYHSSGN